MCLSTLQFTKYEKCDEWVGVKWREKGISILYGAKKCDDFDGCEWGMGKIERKGISEGRGVATWAPHRANKMRRRCTVAKYCASVMTKITYQRGLSRRLFAFVC